MTYKCAVAGLDLGGGKAVMVGDNRTPRREALFRAHGRHIHRLGGRYITAEDVGTAPADMAYVRAETPHVTGLPGKSGDPSPLTAYGVYRGMQACARRRWGADSLAGRRVAIQGVGNVGYHLARLLQRGGAKLVVTDVDAARVKRVVDEFQAEAVRPEEIYGVRAEIFAPCALGGVIDDDTVGRLAVEIVAGGANNPLAEPWHGDALEARGVTYAPDFVVNSGGVINLDAERNGWPAERAREKADQIYDTVLRVLDLARAEGIPSYRAAERLAEQRIANVRRNSG
jgi:leucine dehydrogenase